jgi:hypothetical protein
MINQTLPNDPLVKTHQFEFDINSISVDDLKKLYKHFHIEEFGDVAAANTHEEFYKCFIDDETDGNTDAFLFVRLVALLKSKCMMIRDINYTRESGEIVSSFDLFENKNYLFEFDDCEYYDLNLSDPGFNILLVIQDYAVEDAIPFLENYEFLKPIQ